MKTSEAFQKLILRYILNTISPKEKRRLYVWRKLSPENEQVFQEETNSEKLQESLRRMVNSKELVFKKIQEQYAIPEGLSHKSRSRIYEIIGIAASLIIVVGLSLYFLMDRKKNNRILPGTSQAVFLDGQGVAAAIDDFHRGFLEGYAGVKVIKRENGELVLVAADETHAKLDRYYKLYTPRGGTLCLLLSDGTQTWLNAQTTILYNAMLFTDSTRIRIRGEAYFEIPGNRKAPLRILAGGMQMETTGARFSVSVYPGEMESATLLDGLIKVRMDSSDSEIVLRPGEQVQVVGGKLSVQEQTDPMRTIAWKNGRTYFKGASIQTIMQDISRWYNVDIRYEGTPPVSGFDLDLPRDADIGLVLSKLEKQGVHFVIKDRVISVSR